MKYLYSCTVQMLISQNTSINKANICAAIFKSQDFVAILEIFMRAGGHLWF